MADVNVYIQFGILSLSIVGNCVSIVIAGRWLVVISRREDAFKALSAKVERHNNYLIQAGILPAD